MQKHGSSRGTSRPAGDGLASWYTPGLVDGFGDRLLMYDNSNPDVLELLRFSTALVDTPGFEDLVRHRVTQTRAVSHPSLPVIRAVERLEGEGSLTLVSAHPSGKRLSSILSSDARGRRKLHPAFVTWLLKQITEPLALLESVAGPAGHGTVNGDRIILTPEGRVQVIEHVLGPALGSLDPSPERLWRDFGLLVPPEPVQGERGISRSDVFQLGALALSMLLARRITPADVGERLPELLDQWSEGQVGRARHDGNLLRSWLERALQVGDTPFATTQEALAELKQLPAPSTGRAMALLTAPEEETSSVPVVFPLANHSRLQEGSMGSMSANLPAGQPRGPFASDDFPVESDRASTTPPLPRHMDGDGVPWSSPESVSRTPGAALSRSRGTPLWVGAVLATVAVAEAVVIAALLQRNPTPPAPTVLATAAADLQASPAGQPGVPAAAAIPSAVSPPPATASPAAPAFQLAGEDPAIARAARNQRSGGVRLATSIELTVLNGERVLGSSADGPIIATEGTHQLEFVNAALGFRERRAVTFRAGEITTLAVPVPRGRLNVNAQPWAEVWIDSQQVGETPLANLDIAIGEHEIVFRHPDLGERRQNVLVRADSAARVTTTFDR